MVSPNLELRIENGFAFNFFIQIEYAFLYDSFETLNSVSCTESMNKINLMTVKSSECSSLLLESFLLKRIKKLTQFKIICSSQYDDEI